METPTSFFLPAVQICLIALILGLLGTIVWILARHCIDITRRSLRVMEKLEWPLWQRVLAALASIGFTGGLLYLIHK